MKLSSLHKPLLITIFTLALLSYGFVVVNAAYPLTEWEPGETLDPTCTPGDANCSVANAWQLDLTNGYVFNDTDFVGIGTDTPTVELDILGQINVTDSLVLDPINDGGFLYTHQNLATTMSSSGAVDGQYIFNMNVATTWDDTDDMTNSYLVSLLSTITTADNVGDVDTITSGHFLTAVDGGNVERARGLFASAELTGAGNVNSLQGISVSAVNETGTPIDGLAGGSFRSQTNGDVLEFYGIDGATSTSGVATANFARALGFYSFAQDNSTINDAGGILVRVAKFDTANIGTALGIDISAGLYALGEVGNEVGLYPGVGADGVAYGIRMVSSPGQAAIESTGDIAYGLYVGDGAIDGDTGEYALYVNDAVAENFFRNGVRIGTDDDAYKLASVSTGASSNTLYIGNATVDVTAPSDERTKKNIITSQLSLDDLMRIDMVDFNYDQTIVSDGEELHHGVLAQQVEEVYPYAVTTRSDGYKMVDYKRFIPLIIKSIQDLQQQINNQTLSFIDNVREIFVGKVTTEEFCMGNRCIDEEQFNNLVDLLEQEDNQGVDNESIIENEIVESIEDVTDELEEEGGEVTQVLEEGVEEEVLGDEDSISTGEQVTDVTPVEIENDVEEETPVV